MRVFLWLAIIAAVLAGGLYAFNRYIYNEKQEDEGVAVDYKNGRYLIDGQFVVLENGVSKMPAAPGSSSIVTTTYFGNEVRGDLDADGDEDVAFLLTHDGGGSGTFYYLVAALKESGGYRGTHAVLIGDRIAPQTSALRPDGVLVVNYADRNPGEPMTAQPSVGKSMYLKYDSEANSFGEVVQDFEGEADPSQMSLDMKPWTWIEALYNDGRSIRPRQASAFMLEFSRDGRFTAKTDCNQMGGGYTLGADNAISFDDIVSTKIYCENSQEGEFTQLLTHASHYHFTSRGELILDLKFDSGTATFR